MLVFREVEAVQHAASRSRSPADMRTLGAILLGVLLSWLLHTGQAQGPQEDSDQSGDQPGDEEIFPSIVATDTTTDTTLQRMNSTSVDEGGHQLNFYFILLLSSVSFIFLLVLVIFLVKYCKGRDAKQEPSSQGSQSALQTHELGSENLKVPIFEEDTPSVMEIEMEELDKWMSTRHEDHGCLPPLKEEKEPNLSPSDH